MANLSPGAKLHFVGIGGIGMSGLAQMCAYAGFVVSGSDRGSDRPENRRILDMLELQGIRIYPQDGSYIADGKPDVLVYSTAIEEDNPDFAAGRGIARLHRSQLLADVIASDGAENSIAVTGSCGKSTVTAYLAETLLNLGEDPACLNGALINRFRYGRFAGNFRPGCGKYFVFEADESDKSLVNYSPDYAIILNMGTDHYDKQELARVFAEFLGRVKKGAVLERQVYDAVKSMLPPQLPVAVFESGIGDHGEYAVTSYRNVSKTDAIYIHGRRARLAASGDRSEIETFGTNNVLNIYGMRLEDCRLESSFPGAELAGGGALALPQPGEHMALNALAILVLLEKFLGFERSDILEALARFDGVWRRFDYAGLTASGAKVYDDYAHNPEKIASAIRAAREVSAGGNVLAVFQPHGYGPLDFIRTELFRVLEDTLKRKDWFVMMEPFYAGGTSSFKPSANDVINEYRALGNSNRYLTFPDREALTDFLLLKSKPGDVILIMGARDNSLSDYAVSLTVAE